MHRFFILTIWKYKDQLLTEYNLLNGRLNSICAIFKRLNPFQSDVFWSWSWSISFRIHLNHQSDSLLLPGLFSIILTLAAITSLSANPDMRDHWDHNFKMGNGYNREKQLGYIQRYSFLSRFWNATFKTGNFSQINDVYGA